MQSLWERCQAKSPRPRENKNSQQVILYSRPTPVGMAEEQLPLLWPSGETSYPQIARISQMEVNRGGFTNPPGTSYAR